MRVIFAHVLLSLTAAVDLRGAFLKRAQDYLDETANRSNCIVGDLVRVSRGISDIRADYSGDIQKMAKRADGSDFDAPYLINLLYHAEYLPGGVNGTLGTQLKGALLGWQFWIDQPNGFQSGMQVWTENHHMDFHVAEYLTGSLYSEELFPGTNMTGQEHAEHGKALATRWLEQRYRWGFSEWLSDTYMQFDFHSLSTLVALAPDRELKARAACVLDLLLLDLAVYSFHGGLAGSRGRSYAEKKWDARKQGTRMLSWLLTGAGNPDDGGDGATVVVALLALQHGFDVSEVLLGIARDVDQLPVLSIHDRRGVGPEDGALAAETGLQLGKRASPDDAWAWMGLGFYAHPKVVPLIVRAANTLELFGSNASFFNMFEPFRHLSDLEIEAAANLLRPLTYYGALGPAETSYWRTPNVALASVQDFRKGAIGDQQHTWQATLSDTAVVFTTQPGPNINPDVAASVVAAVTESHGSNAGMFAQLALSSASARASGDYSDGFWTGSASLPRLGQKDNVLLALYRPPLEWHLLIHKQLYPYNFTHAAFPRAEFDEVVDELAVASRIAGRVGDGYVALWSSSENPTFTQEGEDAGREIRAPTDWAGRGAWACVVGDASLYGSFENFTDVVLRTAEFRVRGGSDMQAELVWPSGRAARMDWTGPMTVIEDGGGGAGSVPLSGYGRFEMPWINESFPARGLLTISWRDIQLQLDFNGASRRTVIGREMLI